MEKVNYSCILGPQNFSEDFIRDFKSNRPSKISDNFIRECLNKINTEHIPNPYNLSERFIQEFADRFSCSNISSNQKISEF